MSIQGTIDPLWSYRYPFGGGGGLLGFLGPVWLELAIWPCWLGQRGYWDAGPGEAGSGSSAGDDGISGDESDHESDHDVAADTNSGLKESSIRF